MARWGRKGREIGDGFDEVRGGRVDLRVCRRRFVESGWGWVGEGSVEDGEGSELDDVRRRERDEGGLSLRL